MGSGVLRQTGESSPKHQLLRLQHRLRGLRPCNSQFARIKLGHPVNGGAVGTNGDARGGGAEERGVQ